MNIKDNTGIMRDLEKIEGTSFWSDKAEKLYEVEVGNVVCWPVSPQYALLAVLKRAGVKLGVEK